MSAWLCFQLTAVSVIPLSRDEHTAVLVSNKLIVSGGWSLDTSVQDGYLNDTWSWSLDSNHTWTQVPSKFEPTISAHTSNLVQIKGSTVPYQLIFAGNPAASLGAKAEWWLQKRTTRLA